MAIQFWAWYKQGEKCVKAFVHKARALQAQGKFDEVWLPLYPFFTFFIPCPK